MRRRDFVRLFGGVAAIPLTARAQQADRMRRIGVLHGQAADDSESRARIAAFQQRLEQLGWSDGRNVESTIDGAAAAPVILGNTLRNWSHLDRMLFW